MQRRVAEVAGLVDGGALADEQRGAVRVAVGARKCERGIPILADRIHVPASREEMRQRRQVPLLCGLAYRVHGLELEVLCACELRSGVSAVRVPYALHKVVDLHVQVLVSDALATGSQSLWRDCLEGFGQGGDVDGC